MTTLFDPVDRAAETEERRRRLQAELDGRRSARERNRLGQFATPFPLACDIASAVAEHLRPDELPVRFGEPSVGTGAFYSALLQTLGPQYIAAAVGVEADPEFVRVVRELWTADSLRVVEGDFTDEGVVSQMLPRPTLVLANPPYSRHHHLSAAQKQRLRARASVTAGVDVNGLAGLYVYFMLLAHAWMEEGGLAAWLIPSEFMDVNYGTALKEYLTERVTLIGLHRFDPLAVQFDDALVSSAVVVFRKYPPMAGGSANFTFGGSMAAPVLTEEVSLAELRSSRKWTAYPRASPPPAAIDGRVPQTLGDLFRVRRGIATGANGFFILTRPQARGLGLPEEYLRPILPSPRHVRSTVIERAEDGHPRLDRQLVVIDCELPEGELRARVPTLWAYLETGEERGVRGRHLVGKRSPWYRQEQRPPAPFLCTYMGRGLGEDRPFRFFLNRSDAVAPNVYLMLYPKGHLAELLLRRPNADTEILEALGEITASDLKGEGRVYGGGLHKIEPKELLRLPADGLVRRFPELGLEANRILTLL